MRNKSATCAALRTFLVKVTAFYKRKRVSFRITLLYFEQERGFFRHASARGKRSFLGTRLFDTLYSCSHRLPPKPRSSSTIRLDRKRWVSMPAETSSSSCSEQDRHLGKPAWSYRSCKTQAPCQRPPHPTGAYSPYQFHFPYNLDHRQHGRSATG